MFAEELKKIFKLKSLLIVAAFGVLYYMLFISPHMKLYPGSYSMTVDVGQELLEKYGSRVSPEEYKSFLDGYEVLEAAPGGTLEKVNTFIAGNSLMAKQGITDVSQLEAMIEKSTSPAGGTSELGTQLMNEIYNEFSPEDYEKAMEEQVALDIRKNYIEMYRDEILTQSKSENGTGYYDSLNEQQRLRVYARNKEEAYGVMPKAVYDCTFTIFQFFAFFMATAVLFFIVPYIVKDNRSQVLVFQYTGRAGRRYDLIRVLAVVVAAGIVLAAGGGVFLWLCRLNHIFPFFNSPVSSFASGMISWLPLSLGGLILLGFLAVIVLALGLVLIAFCVTHSCTNYITAIAWMLPMVLAAAVFCGTLLVKFLDISQPLWLAPGLAAADLLLGLIGVLIQWMLLRRRDKC